MFSIAEFSFVVREDSFDWTSNQLIPEHKPRSLSRNEQGGLQIFPEADREHVFQPNNCMWPPTKLL